MAEDKHDKKQNRIIAGSLKNVGAVFDDTAWKAIHIATNSGYDPESGEPFSFSRADTRRKADKMLKQFVSKMQAVVLTGNNVSWANANDKNDELVTTIANGKKIPKELLTQWQQRNLSALKEFNTRTEDGMNLSDRIWKVGQQYRSELELALSLGIGEGKSADVLSRDVRQYLKYPNMLFRRVRDADNNLQLSKPAKAYHPGRGVYRSSYKNALRMTATENNMAYRTADYTRWQQMNFILGIQIKTSPNNHPKTDICDTLKGRYPKEFKFRGWHPWCRCIAVPILPNENAFFRGLQGDLKGEGLPYGNPIVTTPKRFDDWIKSNAERIKDAKNIPYWIKDNFIDGNIKKGFSFTVPEIIEEELFSAFLKKVSVAQNLENKEEISDKELKKIIFDIFDKNKELQVQGHFRRVVILRRKSDEFMAASRKYTDKKWYVKRYGQRLIIYDNDVDVGGGIIYNPYKQLKNAFIAIANKRELSFMEEYAIESLWHEMLHMKAFGWKDATFRDRIEGDIMEMFNEYCARRSYQKLMHCLRVRQRWQAKIISDGFGYFDYVGNLQYFLSDINLNNEAIYKFLLDNLLNKPYENIGDAFCSYISDNTNLTLKESNYILDKLLSPPSEFIRHYSKLKYSR